VNFRGSGMGLRPFSPHSAKNASMRSARLVEWFKDVQPAKIERAPSRRWGQETVIGTGDGVPEGHEQSGLRNSG